MGAWSRIGAGLAKMFGMGALAEKIEDLRKKNADLAAALEFNREVGTKALNRLALARRIAEGTFQPKPLDRGREDWSPTAASVWELRRLHEACLERSDRLRAELEEARDRISSLVGKVNRLSSKLDKQELDGNPY